MWGLAQGQTATVSFPASVSGKALDGRVLFLLSNDAGAEPRMQIDDTPKSQMVFGVTVDGSAAGAGGEDRRWGCTGYPVRKLSEVPAGDYTVQAVLNVYETFHRADGAGGPAGVKLAPDRGEGQHWNLAPGNLYSDAAEGACGAGGSADGCDAG